ncbi:MAG: NUDIX hydrolase [Nitrococcus sp.]|nr:NUDIX hydrolase [Nitrococcus sp.]
MWAREDGLDSLATGMSVAGDFKVAADVVLFTAREQDLAVLLVRRPRPPFDGRWALPGGLLATDETPEAAARRWLDEASGLRELYLEQLYTFGRPDRDPRGRVLSVAHLALLRWQHLASLPSRAAWWPTGALPALALDHGEIVATALSRLAAKLEYSTIALQLMPECFTLSRLQAVYEMILGGPLDKRNFRKRMQALRCIEPTGESWRGGNHRPARLYRIKQPGRVEIVK